MRRLILVANVIAHQLRSCKVKHVEIVVDAAECAILTPICVVVQLDVAAWPISRIRPAASIQTFGGAPKVMSLHADCVLASLICVTGLPSHSPSGNNVTCNAGTERNHAVPVETSMACSQASISETRKARRRKACIKVDIYITQPTCTALAAESARTRIGVLVSTRSMAAEGQGEGQQVGQLLLQMDRIFCNLR